ncbi:hypothetical protein KIW84_034800 [Lathyrus oleraceus]|uniref:RNase H type-1 domain-containing protein n=1 Tax=Pisum sativum TaxID=3888 RepID=A0A9D4Y0C4_PEA|nr:hypothetical protein KIW84_034800 [Pisum sativum]
MWNNDCQEEFDKIRQYLQEPLILKPLVPGPAKGPKPGSRWTIVFDSASNAKGHGVGAMITSPTSFHIPFTARLCFDCTNNMVEYEECIYDIEITIDLRINILEVEHVVKLIPYFGEITFHYIPREENHLANALATLASMFKVKSKNEAPTIHIDHLGELARCLAMEAESDDKPWFHDIKRYLEIEEYPEKASITDKKSLRKCSAKFFLNEDVLYKRNYDSVFLRCMNRHKASTTIRSIHEGCEGVHAKSPSMAKNILWVSHYWTTMEVHYHNFVKRCHKCQIFGDKIHVPLCFYFSLTLLYVGY